jgi:hypothetical protein
MAQFFNGDENDNATATAFMSKLKDLQSANRATILLTHHTNKASLSQDVSSPAAMRGASAFLNAARFGAVLRHAPAKVRDRFSTNTPFIKLSVINADFRVGGCTLTEGLFRYKQYFRAKGYKRYEKIWDVPINGFRLLFVTHAASRLGPISAAIKSMSPSGFVWTTSADRMLEEGISGCIWAPGDRSEQATESFFGGLTRPAPLPELTE